MTITGGCYCGALRYKVDSGISMRAACCCRDCRYMTGGGPNHEVAVKGETFNYVKGAPKQIAGKNGNVIREFCGDCGTHIIARADALGDLVMLKVGTLDDADLYQGPETIFFDREAPAYHWLPAATEPFKGFPK